MNDIYQRRYGFWDYIRLIISYLETWGTIWAVTVIGYLSVLAIVCYMLFNNILQTVNKMIAANSQMMAMIVNPNSSDSQIFVLIQFILMVIVEVILPLIIVFLVLALLHSLVSTFLFVTLDLHVRNVRPGIFKILKYSLSRFAAAVWTDLLIWFYLLVIIILIIAVILSGSFLIQFAWLHYFTAIIVLVCCLLAINWTYVYPAICKYSVKGSKAIEYSRSVVRKNQRTSVIWVAISGSLYLVVLYLLISITASQSTASYPLWFTITLVGLVLYNSLTKIVNSFVFLNCDYLARQEEDASDLYGDLITLKLAPVKVINTDPLRRTRRRTADTLKNRNLKKKRHS